MARWCEEHQRWECTKPRSRGRGPCHAQAIKGTDACLTHCGKTLEQARADALTAWSASLNDEISPRAVVAAEIGLAFRRAEYLTELLRQQQEASGNGQGGGAAGGLVGHTLSASEAAGGVYATGEQIRALAAYEAAWHERAVRFAETGHRMHIEEARTELGESDGAAVFGVIVRALARFGVEPHDPEVREAVYLELTDLAASRRRLTNG